MKGEAGEGERGHGRREGGEGERGHGRKEGGGERGRRVGGIGEV